ncbi:putative LRR receptor-like serine/threonine-protein kinase RKF3 [Acorus gramineus]|uniref:non-specific serine/threonine protein kinase n=1 Tax=Acorus gramineus TaxID=55184 RepID=A0AAV9A2D4_ACOGR|nr:putative LRR receptor-like serine/threonine-protein kinase RKF3 [Acorus gramineus]
MKIHTTIVVVVVLLVLLLPSQTSAADSPQCPLNFTTIQPYISTFLSSPPSKDPSKPCQFALQALHLLLSDYLLRTSLFSPPHNTSTPCWSTFSSLLRFNVTSLCAFHPLWISQGCMNITSRSDFESIVPSSSITDVAKLCNGSLANNSPCASCTTGLSRLKAAYLPGPEIGNVSDCASYPSIYAAAAINRFGPSDPGTALCLFLLNPPPNSSSFRNSSSSSNNGWIAGVVLGVLVFVVALVLGFWFLLGRKKKKRKRKFVNPGGPATGEAVVVGVSTNFVKFTFEEIKSITRNFSRDNIIGWGGYGNVYRGLLPDGSEVALKRFKNCAASGDEAFVHEVEVIASVRHVNLVTLRGYCTATTPLEGHQRIIVCDLVKNSSLHDHLFGGLDDAKKLSWPIRQRIVIGTARGLAYLHYGVRPAIIHRDIKASNILLDENFEPKVADFGLAKFAPEGVSHLSTRVAGTLGYVAPEYALYGQLTEKSDVYSFGVVLLELLSGKKAISSSGGGAPTPGSLVAEWAWDLVRNGKALDVIESGMEDLGPPEVMEKYVLVGVLASHPQVHARPTMDHIVKMLEIGGAMAVPVIPDRPISLIAGIEDIEKSMSSSGSGQLSSYAGYQPFTPGNTDLSSI